MLNIFDGIAEDNMKAAILTIHHVPNYGAVMQAYALKSAVIGLGHDCDVINYQPPSAIEFYRKSRGRFPKSLLHLIRHKRIERFVDRFVTRGSRVIESTQAVFDEVAKYDAVICGSDQIWNCSGFRGLDKTFFLGSADLPSTKKISYAPSIGSSDPQSYCRDWPICGQWLNDFDAISVRDLPSKKMVQSFDISKPELVCDPTLLPKAIDGVVSEKPVTQDYLIIYGGDLAGYGESIRSLAATHDLKIVSIGAPCSFADKTCFFANPKEWAVLFSRAKIVVTGMFHGVQLALLNEALPFFIGTPEKKSKVFDALTRYGLQQQWISKPDDIYAVENVVSPDKMNQVAQLRNEIASSSLGWLQSQLG